MTNQLDLNLKQRIHKKKNKQTNKTKQKTNRYLGFTAAAEHTLKTVA